MTPRIAASMSWTTVVLALAAVAGAPSHLGAGGAPSVVSLTAVVVRERLARGRRYAARRRTKASSAS